MVYRLPLILLLLIGLVAGCGDQNVTKTDQPGPIDSVGRPDSEVRGARIYLYNRGERTTEIRAERILRFDAIDSTMAYVLDVDFFDSSAQVTSNLVGDSGIIRETTGWLEVFGHVVVLTPDSAKLQTDHLIWNPEISKIQTDAFVEITKAGDVITGWGLEADQNLNRIKILRQVSGTITETERLTEP
jgi:LPS export ABC transporter protein LptC